MRVGLMRMEVVGFEKVERILAKMVIDVGGRRWVVDHMILLLNGKKRYNLLIFLLFFACLSICFDILPHFRAIHPM